MTVHRLVLTPFGLLLVQMVYDVLCIHDSEDRIEAEVLSNGLLHEEGLRNGPWVC